MLDIKLKLTSKMRLKKPGKAILRMMLWYSHFHLRSRRGRIVIYKLVPCFILHSSKRPLTSLTKHLSGARWYHESLSLTNIHRSHSKSFQFIYKKLNFPINCYWLFASSNSSSLNTTIYLDKTTDIPNLVV